MATPKKAKGLLTIIYDRTAWGRGFTAGEGGINRCPYPAGSRTAWSWHLGRCQGVAKRQGFSYRLGAEWVRDGASVAMHTEAARELFSRGRRLVAELSNENPVPMAVELPADDLAAADPSYGEDDWWLCSRCKGRCLEDPEAGLPMACHNCDGPEPSV